MLLSGNYDGTALVWDVASGAPTYTLADTSSSIKWLSWSPDGRQALAGSDDGSTRLWDTTTGQEVRRVDDERRALVRRVRGKMLSRPFNSDGVGPKLPPC